MWTRCPPSVFTADAVRMQSVGINTERVFLPVIPTADQAWYRDDWTATPQLLARFDLFLSACQDHGIRIILCFDLDKAALRTGNVQLTQAEHWFRSVITPHKDDPHVLAWDVINEPDADPDPNQNWTPRTADYVRAMFGFAKTLTTQPITFGLAWRGDELRAIGVSPDIYQYHEYGGGSEEHVRQSLRSVREQWPDRVILVGEFGLSTADGRTEADQDANDKNALDAVREVGGVWGTCFWTLWDFPGVKGKEGAFGLLRADGTAKAAFQTILWYH